MPLPPEIRERMERMGDVSVTLKPPHGEQAVIEGKTAVPFGSLVRLILQKKVQSLFRTWQNEPVILSSELLTHIASAPGEHAEDRGKVVLTALVIGACFGFLVTFAGLLLLGLAGITVGAREAATGLVVLLFVALVVLGATRAKTKKAKEGLIERVERVAEMFSR